MKGKTVGIALGAAGVAAAAWVGSAVVIGQQAEQTLRALKSAPQGSLRLTQLTHERSLFGAKGQAELRLEAPCAAEPGSDQPLRLRVDYTMAHLPLPGSLMRVDWQASPLGDTADAFSAVFGPVAQLSGRGTVAFNGALRTEMALPELALQRAGEAIRVAPSQGFLAVNGDALAFGWKIERIVVRGGGQALEVKDMAVDVDLTNRRLGTGTMQFSAQQVGFGLGTAEGVSLRSTAVERGDRLDVTLVPSVRRMQGAGVDLSELWLELAMKGLDTRSVQTLASLAEASCGMQSLTADEGRQAREAAMRLLARGLSVGIPKVSGRGGGGELSGQFLVELREAATGRPSLAGQLAARGHLELSGDIVSPAQRQAALAAGIAVAQGDTLRVAFDYAGGVLKLNDRALDGSQVLAGLSRADAELQALVSGWAAPAGTEAGSEVVSSR
ncbi:MAG: DUF945 family protein [Burkholderiaceae bacterium]